MNVLNNENAAMVSRLILDALDDGHANGRRRLSQRDALRLAFRTCEACIRPNGPFLPSYEVEAEINHLLKDIEVVS